MASSSAEAITKTQEERAGRGADGPLGIPSSKRYFDCLQLPNSIALFSPLQLRSLTFPRMRPLFAGRLQGRLIIAHIAKVVVCDTPERDRPHRGLLSGRMRGLRCGQIEGREGLGAFMLA